MSFSYNTDLSTDKDKVRFNISDTVESYAEFSDEEINAILTETPNVYAASIRCAESMLSKYARLADETVGRVSVKYANIADNMLKVIKNLKRRLGISSGSVYVGGVSINDKNTVESDTDRVKPKFTKDMHDYGTQSSEDENN